MLRTAFPLFALLLSTLAAAAQPTVVSELGSNRFRYPGAITQVVCSPDGRRLAVLGSTDVWVYDFATGRPVWRRRTIEEFDTVPHALAFDASGHLVLLDLSSQNFYRARHFNLASDRLVHEVTFSFATDIEPVFSPDGRLVVAVTGKQVTIYDARTGREVNRLPSLKRGKPVFAEAFFSPAGNRLAAVLENATVRIYDRTSGAEMALVKPPRPFRSAAFSPDGHRFTVVQDDNAFLSLDLRTGTRTKWKPKLSYDQVLALPNDEVLGVELSEMQFHTFDAKTGTLLRKFRGPTDVAEVSLTPDGRTLIVPGNTGQISLWDAATGRKLPQSADDGGFTLFRFHDRDGLSGLSDRGWTRWNLTTGTRRAGREKASDVLSDLSPDGQRVVSVRGGEVVVTNVLTGKVMHRLKLPMEDVVRFVWFKDHGRQVGIGTLNEVLVWDLATHRLRRIATTTNPNAPQGAIPSAGRWFASWAGAPADDGVPTKLRVYDLDGRVPARDLTLPNGGADDLRFTDDGTRLVRAFANAGTAFDADHLPSLTVELFDPTTGRYTRRFAGAFVDLLDVSPDGRVLLTATYDDFDFDRLTVRGVEVATGRVRWELPPIREWTLDGTGFAPDLRRLAVGTSDGVVRVWDLDGEAAVPDATTWGALANPDGAAGFAAVRSLAAFPHISLPLLAAKLPPEGALDAAAVAGWLRDLDAPQFRVRTAAAKQLAAVVPRARPAMEALLNKTPSPEVRQRLTDLLETSTRPGPAEVRTIRAVEVVERILCDPDTPPETRTAARELLQCWASGADGATLTTEAKETLARVRP